jgi:thiamine pyrophosphokinase
MLIITKNISIQNSAHARPKQNRLGKAFDYLYERKIAAVNVVWATGKHGSYNNKLPIVRYREKLES